MATRAERGSVTPALALAWRLVSHPLVFAVAILSLAVEPQVIAAQTRLFGFELSTVHNLLIIALLIPYAINNGINPLWKNPVIVAFTVLLLSSFTLSSRHPDLSTLQSLKSYAAFLLPAVIFELDRDETTDDLLRRLLPFLALTSLAIGVLLYLSGGYSPVWHEYTGALRLQGAGIPAHLAMLGVVSIAASSVLARSSWKYLALMMVNFAIVVWSGTRTSIVVALIALAGYALPQLSMFLKQGHRIASRRLAFVAVTAVLVMLSYLPNLAARSRYDAPGSEAITFSGGQSTEADTTVDEIRINTSGRLAAWSFFYSVAQENLLFGRGLGAGTIANQGQVHEAFRVPHNEYLRLMVDAGIVGLALAVAAYILMFRKVLIGLPKVERVLALSWMVGFSVLALLDNPLSTQQFAIPFWLNLALLRTAPRV